LVCFGLYLIWYFGVSMQLLNQRMSHSTATLPEFTKTRKTTSASDLANDKTRKNIKNTTSGSILTPKFKLNAWKHLKIYGGNDFDSLEGNPFFVAAHNVETTRVSSAMGARSSTRPPNPHTECTMDPTTNVYHGANQPLSLLRRPPGASRRARCPSEFTDWLKALG
jgi:hypothetical protein